MFLFGFEMPCIFGSGFTLPNVFLRRHFAFPEHRPSGQQRAEPEPRRESGWLAEEVLILENWTETTTLPYHPSWSILVCLPLSCHRAGSFFWPKPCQVTWWLEKQLSSSQDAPNAFFPYLWTLTGPPLLHRGAASWPRAPQQPQNQTIFGARGRLFTDVTIKDILSYNQSCFIEGL